MKASLRTLTFAAVTASLYTALSLIFMHISYGPIQFRIAEALTILPYFTPAAIYGLFAGCLVSNIIGGNGIYDIVFGSAATLLAAYVTYRIKNRFLAPLPPVIINALAVGVMLGLLFDINIPFTIITVGFGELVVMYLIGLPLIYVLDPLKNRIFRDILSKYRR